MKTLPIASTSPKKGEGNLSRPLRGTLPKGEGNLSRPLRGTLPKGEGISLPQRAMSSTERHAVGADIIRPPEISRKFRENDPEQGGMIGCAEVILFQNHRADIIRPYSPVPDIARRGGL